MKSFFTLPKDFSGRDSGVAFWQHEVESGYIRPRVFASFFVIDQQ
jgi:hypothetical protein